MKITGKATRNGVNGYDITLEQEQPTLRDQFAMAALQGILACPECDVRPPNEHVASFAYAMADAMLEARKEVKGE